MPRTFPAPNCNGEGFTLIEVIVATAVVALMISAAASTVVAARNASNAGDFLASATSAIGTMQAEAYGMKLDDVPYRLDVEREDITGDPSGVVPVWRVYTLRPNHGSRRVSFSLESRSLP